MGFSEMEFYPIRQLTPQTPPSSCQQPNLLAHNPIGVGWKNGLKKKEEVEVERPTFFLQLE